MKTVSSSSALAASELAWIDSWPIQSNTNPSDEVFWVQRLARFSHVIPMEWQ
jgi:hypothetical protein